MPASTLESRPAPARSALPDAGRFRILRTLHNPDAGILYEAEDKRHGRIVAIKALRQPSPDERKHAERELAELQAISHPNLLVLCEMIVEPQACFFVMEHVAGPTLTAWCRAAHTGAANALPCDEQRLRTSLLELTHALCALHTAGKLHLHIKPDTVHVRPDGRLVLDHFSLLLKWFGETPESMPGVMQGSVEYLSPEQAAASADLGPESDWYAVGALLYEALVGRPPFSGPVMQVLLDKQAAPPAPPRAFVPNVPKDLERLCLELLAIDPDMRPSGADVVRRLSGADDATSTALAELADAPVAFVGQHEPLARLRLAFDAARAGSAVVAYVEGPAGRGKSTLLRQFADDIRTSSPSAVLLQARCHPFEHVRGKALDQLMDGLGVFWNQLRGQRARELIPREAGVLAQPFPVLGRAASGKVHDGDADPLRMRDQAFAVLRDAFSRLTAEQPVLIVIDDAQWLDADTDVLLSDLLRPPETPNLFLILAGDTGWPLPDTPAYSEALRIHVPLAPLPVEHSIELARALLGAPDAARASEVASASRGEPYRIVEQCSALVEGRVSAGSLPERLAGLGEAERRLVESCAVAAQPIAANVLRSAADVPADGFEDRIRSLTALRLLRVADRERVEPAHDLVRQGVLGSLDAESLRRHHAALARALTEDGAAVDVARHYHAAGERPHAIRWVRTAAHHARATLSFGQAAELYALLSALEPGDRDVMLGHAEALAGSGHGCQAASVYAGLAQATDKIAALALERRRAGHLLRSGEVTEGLRVLDGTLRAVGARLAKSPLHAVIGLLLRLLWVRLRGTQFRSRHASEISELALARLEGFAYAGLTLAIVDNVRAADFTSRYLTGALAVGEPDHVARALSMGAVAASVRGRAERAELLAGRARELALSSRNPWVLAATVAAEGTVHYFIENAWKKALVKFEQAETFLHTESGPVEWERDSVVLFSCMCLQWLGDLPELERRVHRYVREADRRGDVYTSVTLRTRCYLLWLVRDDPERAERDLEACREAWLGPERSFHVQHFFLMYARCECALYRGDYRRAEQLLAESARPLRRSLMLRLATIRSIVRHLEARIALCEAADLAATGRLEAARRRAKDALKPARRLARETIPLARAWALVIEAAAAHIAGRNEQAEALLRRGVAGLERTDTMLYAVAARRRLGELLGGKTGRELVAEADVWMRERGIYRPSRMAALLVPGIASSAGPPLLEGARAV